MTKASASIALDQRGATRRQMKLAPFAKGAIMNDRIDPWEAVAGFVELAAVLILECLALYGTLGGGGSTAGRSPPEPPGFVRSAK
jgi:hypothetical protein